MSDQPNFGERKFYVIWIKSNGDVYRFSRLRGDEDLWWHSAQDRGKTMSCDQASELIYQLKQKFPSNVYARQPVNSIH